MGLRLVPLNGSPIHAAACTAAVYAADIAIVVSDVIVRVNIWDYCNEAAQKQISLPDLTNI